MAPDESFTLADYPYNPKPWWYNVSLEILEIRSKRRKLTTRVQPGPKVRQIKSGKRHTDLLESYFWNVECANAAWGE